MTVVRHVVVVLDVVLATNRASVAVVDALASGASVDDGGASCSGG
jgi:hypothetical protein